MINSTTVEVFHSCKQQNTFLSFLSIQTSYKHLHVINELLFLSDVIPITLYCGQ